MPRGDRARLAAQPGRQLARHRPALAQRLRPDDRPRRPRRRLAVRPPHRGARPGLTRRRRAGRAVGRARRGRSGPGCTTSSPIGSCFDGRPRRHPEDLGGRAGDSRRADRRHPGRDVGGPPARHRRRRRGDVRGPVHPPRPGDRTVGQLVQPGAVRPAHRPAVGAGDRRRAPARRLRVGDDVPPDVPLRVAVEPRPVRRDCCGSTAGGSCPAAA